mmetsp:Transcript_14134/g.27194  ORF Transcript_14134/g.27194 Transcript_14134/m.27194 type:complete len:148 (+) Transcript_14134:213-656(+)|eukprot:CAMPEP_0197476320 /NCGR_PEP_ID=MMETSP1309-20131121/7626_1 /TAXON_ID=464262 /ORGANISM="Genus nov. species nov., Strain RCC998" /LENGTH=147 /DNA_ID=CAMNT_0043016545 /DNA_START=173 /DNA_END=616 /DNA_ORIENTATION=-
MNTFANPMGQESPGLARSYTRSSKHELLKQIRDAVNPNQRSHNIILITQTAMVTIAVVLLVIFALLAQVELTKLNEASKDEIIPNLDSIIDSLDSIEKGVDESYQMTQYMPLLYDMNTLSGYIEGNLTITVDAMTKSPLFLSGGFGR